MQMKKISNAVRRFNDWRISVVQNSFVPLAVGCLAERAVLTRCTPKPNRNDTIERISSRVQKSLYDNCYYSKNHGNSESACHCRHISGLCRLKHIVPSVEL